MIEMTRARLATAASLSVMVTAILAGASVGSGTSLRDAGGLATDDVTQTVTLTFSNM